VLIVDDNEDAANTLGMILEMEGHDVRTAYDARRALEMAKMHVPDAILLDIGLPGTDGYELAQQIRALPALDKVLLVAVTGFGQDQDRRRAEQASFNAHLVKPVEPGILKALLEQR
jgi:CheY-like chemotaxis protein